MKPNTSALVTYSVILLSLMLIAVSYSEGTQLQVKRSISAMYYSDWGGFATTLH